MTYKELSADMRKCLDHCSECHRICLETVAHCIRMGGKHVQPEHLLLMLDCIAICEASMQFLSRGSGFHAKTCGVCAEVCRACADSCQKLSEGDDVMQRCADVCRHCAEHCRKMASGG